MKCIVIEQNVAETMWKREVTRTRPTDPQLTPPELKEDWTGYKL